jgi:hypothetical protein
MAGIQQLRTGIANNLAAALTNIQVSPYLLDNPTPPACHVVPGPVTYDQAMQRGVDTLEFRVQLFVGSVADIGAQKLLDQYMDGSGGQSVKQAVQSDPTLGGAAFNCSVVSHTGLQQYVRGESRLLMCEWVVTVLAHG